MTERLAVASRPGHRHTSLRSHHFIHYMFKTGGQLPGMVLHGCTLGAGKAEAEIVS